MAFLCMRVFGTANESVNRLRPSKRSGHRCRSRGSSRFNGRQVSKPTRAKSDVLPCACRAVPLASTVLRHPTRVARRPGGIGVVMPTRGDELPNGCRRAAHADRSLAADLRVRAATVADDLVMSAGDGVKRHAGEYDFTFVQYPVRCAYGHAVTQRRHRPRREPPRGGVPWPGQSRVRPPPRRRHGESITQLFLERRDRRSHRRKAHRAGRARLHPQRVSQLFTLNAAISCAENPSMVAIC